MSQFASLIVAIVLVLNLIDATAEVSSGDLLQKAEVAARFWEYEDNEFRSFTFLDEEERDKLERFFSGSTVYPEEKHFGLKVLAVLNCTGELVNFPVYQKAQQYLCSNGRFELFFSEAATSMDGLYLLGFVKKDDAERVDRYLDDYMEFLSKHVKISVESTELIREIQLKVRSSYQNTK